MLHSDVKINGTVLQMNKKPGIPKEHLPSHVDLFIREQELFTKKDKLLLAVSGGVDSIAMFHLLRLKGYDISVAHCNFSLRNRQSDKDEKFVKELCELYAVPFFSKRFDTRGFSEDHGVSLQMAARDLRYEWFHQLLESHHLDYICTAHHQNDSVESVLLNLSRETGLNGLTGIKASAGKIRRPLMFATKDQLVSYVKLHGFKFRKDKSNDDIKYRRNLVRNKIIPLFEKINPSFVSSVAASIGHFTEAQKVLEQFYLASKKKVVSLNKDEMHVDLSALEKLRSPSLFLHHLLSEIGIPSSSKHVEELLSSQPGKFVETSSFTILRDRGKLVISPNIKEKASESFITENEHQIEEPVRLTLAHSKQKLGKLKSNEILVSSHELVYPLQVRSWKKGDYFIPFGMKGKKKISDLLIDMKVQRNHKKNTYLLVNGDGRVIWVIGLRADDRFKIKDSNEPAIIVKLLSPD